MSNVSRKTPGLPCYDDITHLGVQSLQGLDLTLDDAAHNHIAASGLFLSANILLGNLHRLVQMDFVELICRLNGGS